MTNATDEVHLTRLDDHDTSIAAAKMIERKLSKLQRGVHQVMKTYPNGLTDGQLTDAMHRAGYPETAEATYRKRRTDLTAMGYVEWTGERRAVNGKPRAKVWRVVPGKELPAK